MQKKINVIGHLGSSAGLGNTARLFVEVLLQRGYEVAGLDVDYHPGEDTAPISNIMMVRSVDELPFDVNLIVVSIMLLPSIWRRRMPGLLSPRFRNIGLIFWELPVIPSAWLPSLELFDAIVVCSHYVRQTIESALPEVPTLFAEHPLRLRAVQADSNSTREALGIKPTDFVFACSFDLRSDFSRKNPMAVLDAFQAAFPKNPDVRLLIKANGRPQGGDAHPVVQKILTRISSDPRIVLVAETLPYEGVMGLYAACDVYVSLHRAEGLGLGPMEAMLLSKLVIATGYSGNMTYMTQQNSLPVPYRLIEPTQTGWQFGRGFSGRDAAWAEPDMTAATAAMRLAYEQPELRVRLARAGHDDILRRQETAWAASYLDELEGFRDTPVQATRRQRLRRRVVLNEFFDSTLRALNWQAWLAHAKAKLNSRLKYIWNTAMRPLSPTFLTQFFGKTTQYLKQRFTDVSIIVHNLWFVRLPLAQLRFFRHTPSADQTDFLILPGDPDAPTGSIGDMAMFTGLMQSLLQTHPNASFTLVGTHAHQVHIPQIGNVDVVSAWTGRHGAVAFDHLVRQHRALFVLGADIMDGMYGAALVCRLLAYCNHAAHLGLPTTILGFSFSSTPRNPAVHALARAHPAVQINVRDTRSLARFSKATGRQAQLSADVAFLMTPAWQTSGEVESWIALMRQAGRTVVGVNLSTHALANVINRHGGDALIAAVAEQLLHVGEKLGLAYVLIPHDVKPRSGDVHLLTSLEVALQSAGFSHVRYTAQEDPAHIKALVSLLDLVLTSRMHLAIASLGMGTPTLCVAYLDKFEGLYDHFGLPANELLTGGSINISDLGRHLAHALEHRVATRRQLLEKMPRVLQLARRNLDAVTT